MTLQQIGWLTGVGAFILSALIEHFSKSFKPWSIIARAIGRAINAENLEKLDNINKRIDKIEANDTKQSNDRLQDKAEDSRRRIINFSDEIRRSLKHSLENFNNILDDITFYKNYCRTHPEFQNEKAVHSIAFIEEAYDKCIKENSFL